MMTALCAARNILGANFDLWSINTEPEYHEDAGDAVPIAAQATSRPGGSTTEGETSFFTSLRG